MSGEKERGYRKSNYFFHYFSLILSVLISFRSFSPYLISLDKKRAEREEREMRHSSLHLLYSKGHIRLF